MNLSLRNASLGTPADLTNRMCKFLRSRHPVKPAHQVAERTGLSVDTVSKWFAGETTPNGPAILKLMLAYGPSLLAAVIPSAPEWILDAADRQEGAAIQAQFDALHARRIERCTSSRQSPTTNR